VSRSGEQLSRVLAALGPVRGPDKQGWYTGLCPFHNDRDHPNLRFTEKGYSCLACDAKGSLGNLAQALGVAAVAGEFDSRIEATYDYRDEAGALLFQVVRLHSPKEFPQRRPDGAGGWMWNVKGVRRVLYRLPELLAEREAAVFVVEGEKDADRLRGLGLVATTNPGGAGKWRDEYNESLRGRKVVILPDNDDAGRKHVEQVARSVHRVASEVRVLDLPGLPEKGDVSDWLAAGGTAEQLLELAEATPLWAAKTEQAEPAADFYFPKGFAAKRVAERLREDTTFATGGGQLHVYKDGVYRPDGASYVYTRTAQLLEDRWTKRNAEEVVAFLSATSPPLWERPPLHTVNVANGLLDVNTGELRRHTPEFLSPVQIGAAFDPGATCEPIDRFLDEVFPGDARLLPLELAGHLMIPDTSQERAVMLLGGGANGKSTFLTLLQTFLGASANVAAVHLQALDANRFAAAQLYGKLANIVADLDAEAIRSSGTFKAIVSGDLISAEQKYGKPFSFRPYARLLFSANEPPPTHDTTYAFFRRWLIVPFDATFTGDRQDKHLAEKLTTPAQLSGLLNRALEGLLRLQERSDFAETASLRAAKQDFRTAVDSAAAFVFEDCVLSPEERIARPELYLAYRAWCERVTRLPLSARKFNERVKTLLPNPDAAVVIVTGTEHWQGLTLRVLAPHLAAASDPITLFSSIEEPAQGGEQVEKVEEVPTLLPPGGGEEKREEEGVREERVGRTATLSTQPPPAAAQREPCRGGCGTLVLCGRKCSPCADAAVQAWKEAR
jgi:putative DNA primase/helicase